MSVREKSIGLSKAIVSTIREIESKSDLCFDDSELKTDQEGSIIANFVNDIYLVASYLKNYKVVFSIEGNFPSFVNTDTFAIETFEDFEPVVEKLTRYGESLDPEKDENFVPILRTLERISVSLGEIHSKILESFPVEIPDKEKSWEDLKRCLMAYSKAFDTNLKVVRTKAGKRRRQSYMPRKEIDLTYDKFVYDSD